MRRSAALLAVVVGLLWAVPAVAAPPAWQAVAAAATPGPTPSPTPAVSPSPKPRGPQSPAAFLAIIVTLAVLGAGVMVVLRARWR